VITSSAVDRNRRILVVDDMPAIHGDFRKILTAQAESRDDLDRLELALLGECPEPTESAGFELDGASQGEQGLGMVQAAMTEQRPYALAFVDVRMPPGWDGVETIEQLWRVDPELQIVICSAHSDYSWEAIQQRLGTTDGLLILRKPFDRAEVIQLAHALTSKWGLHRIAKRRHEELEMMIRARTAELEGANVLLADEIRRRAEMETELRLGQKLQAIGQLAAGIAHEINTPIQYVSDNVDFLRSSFTHIDGLRHRARELVHELAPLAGTPARLDELVALEKRAKLDYLGRSIPRAFEAASQGLEQIATIVRAMKQLAHPGGNAMAPADLDRLLVATLEIARSEYKHVADVVTTLGGLPPVMCSSGELGQVFLNLIVNAAHAVADVVGSSGGRGTIGACTRLDGDDVVIEISDTGGGVPEAIRHRIFDPFFTTKEVGRGSGQGLAIARAIVGRHHGSLSLESSAAGTTFSVRLAIAEARVDVLPR
jgi:two-component system, NtrC family, sensor kinase